MYGEYSYTKKDQQVPTLSGGSSSQPIDSDPRVPLLEEILTHEQNTCIEVCLLCYFPFFTLNTLISPH